MLLSIFVILIRILLEKSYANIKNSFVVENNHLFPRIICSCKIMKTMVYKASLGVEYHNDLQTPLAYTKQEGLFVQKLNTPSITIELLYMFFCNY